MVQRTVEYAANHSTIMIAKRSLSLSKTYVVISIFLSIIGIVVSNVGHALLGLNLNGITQTQALNQNSLQVVSALPLISVPLMVFSTLTFATPVMLLFVYDKNNGVLEYFLSLGMNQTDIYRGYLKAALLLASVMFSYEILTSLVIGFIANNAQSVMLETSLLTPIIGYPAVSFVTVAMMAFGSLQKQRVGSNQPLGMGLGVMLVLPTYIIPLVVPGLAIAGDLVVAILIIVLSVSLFVLASKLIRREKLLP